MEMDGPVDGEQMRRMGRWLVVPRRWMGPVRVTMQTDGPVDGEQRRRMGQWIVIQGRRAGRGRVGNEDGWAGGLVSHGD